MELRLEPGLAAKVERWSAETGRPAGEVVEDAIVAYFSELDELRRTLDTRYDDVASGSVRPVDGEEAYRLLKERAETRRKFVV